MVGLADRSRDAGAGYTVAARYRPSLRAPVSVDVDVTLAGALIGSATVPAVDGGAAYWHTALYVPEYAHALTYRAPADDCDGAE